jgi:nicotinamide-nucleotide amidase
MNQPHDLRILMLGPPRRTLAVAESVTCGRLQARLGRVSGASDFFLGGITAYSLDQKARHLAVDRAAAAAVNCVSAVVAEQMARGVCLLFNADLGVATTGYAEPSPLLSVGEPFAWWAVARRGTDGEFAVCSGRIAGPGLSRIDAQERFAAAAETSLIAWLASTATDAARSL